MGKKHKNNGRSKSGIDLDAKGCHNCANCTYIGEGDYFCADRRLLRLRGKEVEKAMNAEWILKAMETIKSGLCEKLEKGNITVYKCGKIIRIDIKNAFENE